MNHDSAGEETEEEMDMVFTQQSEGDEDEEPDLKEAGLNLQSSMKKRLMNMSVLQNLHAETLNTGHLIQAMRNRFGRENLFVETGKALDILGTTTNFFYVKPPEEEQALRVKRERAKVARANKEKENVQTFQIHEETAEDNSITKELDKIFKHLKKAWKNSPTKDSVGYYEFVLNPNCFAKSVENMFYVSFLIKDAQTRLVVNKETHIPVLSKSFEIKFIYYLEKITREEKEQLGAEELSNVEKTQVITTMTHDIWQRLVTKLNITEPMID